MQQQKYSHKIPLTGGQDQLAKLEIEGHTGVVEVDRDKEGKVTASYLLCTKHHADGHDKAEVFEQELETFTRKPELDQAEGIMERVGSTYPQQDMTREESNRREGRYEHE